MCILTHQTSVSLKQIYTATHTALRDPLIQESNSTRSLIGTFPIPHHSPWLEVPTSLLCTSGSVFWGLSFLKISQLGSTYVEKKPFWSIFTSFIFLTAMGFFVWFHFKVNDLPRATILSSQFSFVLSVCNTTKTPTRKTYTKLLKFFWGQIRASF